MVSGGKIVAIFFTVCGFSKVFTFNILGVFPYYGKSHFFVFEPYLLELARRGHNVTVISHFPQKTTVNNYKDISLAGNAKRLEGGFPMERSYRTIIEETFDLVNVGINNCKSLLSNREVQNLWKTKTKFDVVITEQFVSDCSLGLAYKLGAPVVGVNSHVLLPWHYERYGIQYNPSYVSFLFLGGGTKPSLYQRIERLVLHTYCIVLYKLTSQRIDQKTLAAYFDDIPPLADLSREIKFMLSYTDLMLFGSRLLPSNVIEVNGYHVAKPKTLPDNIRKYIEESKHGVIYISFGSILKASTMPKDKVVAIVEALSQLPQRIIWKWEHDSLPGDPKNIFLSSWLPQNDILAHPKVVAFFSHCGLLSTTEAIHHGVPMLAMPVVGDQPGNAAAVEESGLGLRIGFQELTTENILAKLKTILEPRFRNNVKKLSKAYRDKPISAMDSAIFWTEYAAQHNFTYRSRAADVSFYQYLYLDIIFTIVALISTLLFILCKIFSIIRTPTASKSIHKTTKRE